MSLFLVGSYCTNISHHANQRDVADGTAPQINLIVLDRNGSPLTRRARCEPGEQGCQQRRPVALRVPFSCIPLHLPALGVCSLGAARNCPPSSWEMCRCIDIWPDRISPRYGCLIPRTPGKSLQSVDEAHIADPANVPRGNPCSASLLEAKSFLFHCESATRLLDRGTFAIPVPASSFHQQNGTNYIHSRRLDIIGEIMSTSREIKSAV
ncbi:hypothetical protein B0T25DRAFT_524996 [Lasiosphaeria hispida]|uniref:Uncharacterized protein n=1 Tax=Lasiosphaeria hispida TaxID=260671 RepID=A0AAJ0HU73_9PEZI|nr:hypothetical protein B0T25DRAFT_524996 [Lasiosphaeria hispida]